MVPPTSRSVTCLVPPFLPSLLRLSSRKPSLSRAGVGVPPFLSPSALCSAHHTVKHYLSLPEQTLESACGMKAQTDICMVDLTRQLQGRTRKGLGT